MGKGQGRDTHIYRYCQKISKIFPPISQPQKVKIFSKNMIDMGMNKDHTDECPDLTNLQKALDTKPKALVVEDCLELAKPFLSNKAVLALTKRPEGNDNSLKHIYLTARAKTVDMTLAFEALAQDINRLVEADLIVETLIPMSSIKMANMPLQAETRVAMSYLLVPTDRYEEAKTLTRCFTLEGGIGPTFGDIGKTPEEGYFLMELQMYPFQPNFELALKEEIDTALRVLPKGTKLVSITPCYSNGISSAYEIEFYNPLMKSFKSIEFDFQRHAEIHEDRVKEFNLLTGIKYNRR